MDQRLRDFFDRQLETVLYGLPKHVLQLLDEVPLHVEDYPPPELLTELGLEHRDELCGLHYGIPLTERSVMHSGNHSNVVTIYREGIFRISEDRHGQLDLNELRRQIRITVLHELAHYHGIGEEELRELGYG